jgi:hypothetical protein
VRDFVRIVDADCAAYIGCGHAGREDEQSRNQHTSAMHEEFGSWRVVAGTKDAMITMHDA